MRFGHPLEIVSDRETHFLNDVICDITTKYLINYRKMTPYNLKANGMIGKVLNKLVAAYKTDWDLKLPSAVHAYNTSEKRTTGRNPYFLVFGQLAVHEIKLEVETHRIIAARTGNQIEDLNARLIAIKDLEEARNEALDRTAEVQTKKKRNSTQSFRTIMELHKEGWCCCMTTATKNFRISFIPDGWDLIGLRKYIQTDPSNWKIFKEFG